MKQLFSTNFNALLKHRRLLAVLVVLLLVMIITVTYVAVTIEASDLRIITHYTAYGIAHFYRDSWVYLISFILFLVLTAAFAIAICLKLLQQERESLALWFGWTSIAMMLITLITYIHLTELV